MSPHSLAGVYAAAVTPLKEDGQPDLAAIPPFLDFLARRGCHGVLLLGTTGEGPSFSPEERAAIWRAALEVRAVHPTLKLLAGSGTPSLTETIALTRLAFDLGFDAAVVLPPYYFRKADEEGLFRYFAALIRQAVPADGCLLGYHFPAVAGIGFSLDLLARLKDAFPRAFAGLKDSSHDPDLARRLGERFGPDLLVLTGTDSYLQLALEQQAGGCITAPANLISPSLRAIWDGFARREDLSALQAQVAHKRHVLEQYLPFPPILKALLHRMYGLPRWEVRPPLVEVGPEDEQRALMEMQND
ncbi:MAG: dihydrodipicolinate synthase family protein [Anaerolineales bacterium]